MQRDNTFETFAAFSSPSFGCYPECTVLRDVSISFPCDPFPFKVAGFRYAVFYSESDVGVAISLLGLWQYWTAGLVIGFPSGNFWSWWANWGTWLSYPNFFHGPRKASSHVVCRNFAVVVCIWNLFLTFTTYSVSSPQGVFLGAEPRPDFFFFFCEPSVNVCIIKCWFINL